MSTTPVIILGLVILASAVVQAPNRARPAWSQNFQGWQKLFGVAAVVLALLMILNPEFLALGLLGDTAFFDVLVLCLGLQMQMVAARALACFRAICSKIAPVVIWRLWRSGALMFLAFAPAGDVVIGFRKMVSRISARARHVAI